MSNPTPIQFDVMAHGGGKHGGRGLSFNYGPLDDSFAQKLAGCVRAKGGRLRILSSTAPLDLSSETRLM